MMFISIPKTIRIWFLRCIIICEIFPLSKHTTWAILSCHWNWSSCFQTLQATAVAIVRICSREIHTWDVHAAFEIVIKSMNEPGDNNMFQVIENNQRKWPDRENSGYNNYLSRSFTLSYTYLGSHKFNMDLSSRSAIFDRRNFRILRWELLFVCCKF